ncbi:hypothetical protein IQ22_04145 [Pseudomonas duriflava]|uniref:Uncharacterized protein n=1 Tax=Pseudomonas duriflava TaxID=459528 RepID=A0A562PVN9_9PSED|nr:hypothetical protein [Pseudomonas duriflava]TWI48230.1 hypothetical protein IQ22_04145 [Pseudomonas duriflava]
MKTASKPMLYSCSLSPISIAAAQDANLKLSPTATIAWMDNPIYLANKKAQRQDFSDRSITFPCPLLLDIRKDPTADRNPKVVQRMLAHWQECQAHNGIEWDEQLAKKIRFGNEVKYYETADK